MFQAKCSRSSVNKHYRKMFFGKINIQTSKKVIFKATNESHMPNIKKKIRHVLIVHVSHADSKLHM